MDKDKYNYLMDDKITERNIVYYNHYKAKYPDIEDIVLRRIICRIIPNNGNMAYPNMLDRMIRYYISNESELYFFKKGIHNPFCCD